MKLMRLIVMLGLLLPAAAQAAEMSYSDYAVRKRAMVERQVAPGDAIAADFWRLYDAYAAEVTPIMARRDALGGRDTASADDVAAFISTQEDLVDARKGFVRKLRRADVPADVIMRFLLLEQHLDAVYSINESQGHGRGRGQGHGM